VFEQEVTFRVIESVLLKRIKNNLGSVPGRFGGNISDLPLSRPLALLHPITSPVGQTGHLHIMANTSDRESDDETAGFFSISEDLVQLPIIRTSTVSQVDFDGLLHTPIKLYEDLANGCGGQMWPAGMVLAKYMLLRHRESLLDKSMSGNSLFHFAFTVGFGN
jgi:hypothetical protein